MENKLESSKKISELLLQKEFTEIKNSFGQILGSQKTLYDAKEVNRFLSTIIIEAEKLEKQTEKLYNYYRKNEELKNSGTQSANPEVNRQFNEVSEQAKQNTSTMPEGVSKIQGHMTELLVQAEAKSKQIIEEAEETRATTIGEAKLQAKEILEAAQEKSNEMSRKAQEKIDEFRTIKQDIETRAIEIQKDLLGKASKVEDMGRHFVDLSRNLKNLVNEETEEKMA